jgi:Uma2 family endonuclease
MSTGIASTPTTTETLLTAEQYLALPDDGKLTELVRGRIVEMPSPTPSHGYVCLNVGVALSAFVRANDLGRVVSNDSGVKTERGPDTVRGPDLAFYSYNRVPRGPLPEGYWPAPELVIEVRSPSDRWPAITAKAGEYLNAGVVCVCVVDPETESVAVYLENELPRRHTSEEELTIREVLPGFTIPIRRFFE